MDIHETLKRVESHDCAKGFWKTVRECVDKQVEKEKHKYNGFRCVCGKEVAKNQRYCEYCGQKLMDWNDKKKSNKELFAQMIIDFATIIHVLRVLLPIRVT